MTPMVELRSVTKKFGDFSAVDDISLTVHEGEFCTLLGPSGCGKSTTLRMIAGFETLNAGEILIDGKSSTLLPPYRRNTAMVFQGYALFPHRTVIKNVLFGLRMRRMGSKREQLNQATEALKQVGLEGFEDRFPRELSGGQQQRVALARAIVVRPAVLLLDEPLSALDLKLRRAMRYELKHLQNVTGITTIYVTHDQEEAMSMSDKVVVMNAGKIEQIGSPEDIYLSPKSEFVADFIGESNLFHGTVNFVNDSGGGTVAVPGFDRDLRFPPPGMGASAGTVKTGDDISVVVRPEDIRVANEKTDDLVWHECRSAERIFLGKTNRYFLMHEGSDQLVIADVKMANSAGEISGKKAYFGWSDDSVILIKKNSKP